MSQKIVRSITLFALIAICFSIFSLPVMAAEIPTDFPCYGTVFGSNAYGGLKVRTAPNTSSQKLGALPDGSVIDLLSKSGSWYQINYNGKNAYISSSYVKLGCDGIITASTLNVRSGPGTNYSKVGMLKQNDTVRLLGKNGWYRFYYNGQIAYISSNPNYVKMVSTPIGNNNSNTNTNTNSSTNSYITGTITADRLNVRTGPSMQYTLIGVLYRNAKITILGQKNGWYQISYKSYEKAYVSSKYVSLESPSNPKMYGFVSDNFVNVRTGPSTRYDIVGKLYFGTRFAIEEKEGNWYRIIFNYKKAYVSATCVETDPNAFSGMGMVIKSDVVNIRTRATTSSSIQTRVIRGGILKITSNKNWFNVEANGKTGSIHRDYIDPLTFQEYYDIDKGETRSGNVIAQYSTSFKNKNPNSIKNIKSGAGFINGVIVPPGETFDYYGLTHPNGFVYEVAPVIVNGKYSQSRGGGLCQPSCTIYAAIKSAEESGVSTGLSVTARFPHSKPVGYVPVKYEAAISSYWQTFAFRNVNTYPVKIIAETSKNTLTIKIIRM